MENCSLRTVGGGSEAPSQKTAGCGAILLTPVIQDTQEEVEISV